jgi:hypothetical protein
MWCRPGRADVIVRSARPVDWLRVEVESLIRTADIDRGVRSGDEVLVPKQVQAFDLKTSGVRGFMTTITC